MRRLPGRSAGHANGDSCGIMKLRHIIIAVLLFLPFLVRDYTAANELKYVSIADESIENGSLFAFYNHGVAYADKPPLYMWLVMLGRWLFGDGLMWFVGLFSLLPMIGVMVVMDRWVRMECDKPNSYAADMALATTGMFLGAGMVLRMDMLMTFFIVLSLFVFYRLYRGVAHGYERWALPVLIFMALFTKGPYGVMIPLVAMASFLAWKRELRTFGRYFGWRQLLVLVALCAVWWGCVYAEGGKEYISDLLFRQTVGRGVNSFHHKAPFWYYAARLPMAMAPWSLLYIAVFVTGLSRRFVCTDVERFFIATVVSTTVMLSVISAKLDIYLIPMYPFLVYLCAMWLRRVEDCRYVKAALYIPLLLFALAAVAVPIMLYRGTFGDMPVGTAVWTVAAAVVLSAGSILAIVEVARNRASRGVIVAAWAIMATVAVATPAIPYFNRWIGLGELCREAERTGIAKYAQYGFRYSENMDVYLGTSPEEIESLEALDAVGEPTVLLVDERAPRRDAAFAAWLSERELAATVGGNRIYVIGEKKKEILEDE